MTFVRDLRWLLSANVFARCQPIARHVDVVRPIVSIFLLISNLYRWQKIHFAFTNTINIFDKFIVAM